MKITCPHCKQALSFADEKLRDYLGVDDSWEDVGAQPGRQTWIVIIIAAAAVAGMIGFGGGALLTSPNRKRTEGKIAGIHATAAKEVQQANQQLTTAGQNLQKSDAKVAQLEKRMEDVLAKIASLHKENRRVLAAKAAAEEKLLAMSTLPPSKKPPGATSSSGGKSIDESIARLLKEGVVHSVDVEFNEVRMDPLLWAGFTLEAKQGTVMLFSKYFDSKGSTGRVTVLSNRNDTKLATYGSWEGIKILR